MDMTPAAKLPVTLFFFKYLNVQISYSYCDVVLHLSVEKRKFYYIYSIVVLQ